jgi:hypothetical protein
MEPDARRCRLCELERVSPTPVRPSRRLNRAATASDLEHLIPFAEQVWGRGAWLIDEEDEEEPELMEAAR